MRRHWQSSHIFSRLLKCLSDESGHKGSMLIYIIVTIAFFGILGTALVSVFSASAVSSHTPNYANKALYMAESGMRYALSVLKNTGTTSNVISTLNSTTYTLTNGGSFNINIFGKWFESSADQALSATQTLMLTVPQGTLPSEFSVSDNTYLVNIESLKDSINFTGNPDTKFSAQAITYQNISDTSFSMVVNDDFEADQGEAVHLAVLPGAQSVTEGNSVTVSGNGIDAFPSRHGSFYVLVDEDNTGAKTEYYYEAVVGSELTNISSDLVLDADDFIILSENNHKIVTTGNVAGMSSGDNNTANMGFPLDITNPPPIEPPEAEEQSSDLPEDDLMDELATPLETAAGAVTVDTVTGEITLGGGIGLAYGSVWFGGDLELGGLSDFCVDGECQFNYGVRVFFLIKYQGAGDGITFAFVNGDNNSTNSTGGFGGSGELMAYGGPGNTDGLGLQPPKMALEFDTYFNSGYRNDPLSFPIDALQYVFWGEEDNEFRLLDDNQHYEGGKPELWSFTTPTGDVKTKPAIRSNGSRVYFGSDDGNLYAVNSDGSLNWTYTTSGAVQSSPLLSSDASVVYVGSDDLNVYAVNSDSSLKWTYTTGGAVKSSPEVSANGLAVYVGSEDNFLYSIDTTDGSENWKYLTSGAIRGKPTVHSSDGTIYIGSMDGKVYAIDPADGSKKWEYDTGQPVESSPTLNSNETVIYIGSNDDYLYAIETDGSFKWRFPTIGDVKTKPAINSSDGTIYIGSMDGKLYAINPNDGSKKWEYDTNKTIESSPTVSSDGTIVYFGSQEHTTTLPSSETYDHSFYALHTDDGSERWKFDTGNNVRSSPAISSDGARLYVGSDANSLHAFSLNDNAANIKENYITYEDLMSEISVYSSTNWLNGNSAVWNDKLPWAVRMEIHRSTLDGSGKGKYELKTWIRQCTQTDGSDIRGTYFSDTRIEYQAKTPHLEQTIELSAADHTKFETFLFGVTEATGGATQTAVLSNVQLGFIRPGDTVITTDLSWP